LRTSGTSGGLMGKCSIDVVMESDGPEVRHAIVL
jgi:hypothetical protein